MDLVLGSFCALVSLALVAGMGLILIDGPAVLFRRRESATSPPPPPLPDRGPPFRPPEMPPLLLKWPSEVAIPFQEVATLRWPSSGWNDPHFGVAARKAAVVEKARSDAPSQRDTNQANERAAVGERAAASGRSARAPAPPSAAAVGALTDVGSVRRALDEHGLGPVVEALQAQRGWNAKQIAAFLRKIRSED
jgi:hypothetical protein